MSNSTKAIFGRRVLHQTFAEDYINWADEMLTQGYDSPHLRILAGLDRRGSIFEVEKYFLRSIKELNIEEIEPKAAIRAYACEIAQEILNGQFASSRETIRALYQLCVDTNYDSDYLVWLELDDALDNLLVGRFPYTYPSATLENFDAIVQQEAAKLIATLRSTSYENDYAPEKPCQNPHNALHLSFFKFVHNARKRSEALLSALLENLFA